MLARRAAGLLPGLGRCVDATVVGGAACLLREMPAASAGAAEEGRELGRLHTRRFCASPPGASVAGSVFHRRPFASYMPLGARTASSGGPCPPPSPTAPLSIEDLYQKVYVESGEDCSLSVEDFYSLCRYHHVENPTAALHALEREAKVFRYSGTLYTSPRAVADLVYQVMPEPRVTEDQLRQEIAHIREQLDPLEATLQQANRSAAVKSQFAMYGTLGFLVFQLVAFIRLTYYELSWDIMEPTAYFVQIAGSVAAAVYFMAAGHDHGYESMERVLTRRFTRKALERAKFDEELHQELVDRLDRAEDRLRLVRSLAQSAKAAGAAG
ncbi:unnamed protein product [Pedinophyceae sp. YPF-701]|nr:unnamed protein product [Pedinophyceae sp. YPF-701]